MAESISQTLSESKSLCVAHKCPQCHATGHVTVEHILTGAMTVTRCHCRACGHSWHPVVEKTTGDS